jgi:ABC-type multidrug transport system fused ATPase/permease subunit
MLDISRLKALFRCLTPAEQGRWLWLLPLTAVVAVVEGLVAFSVFAALRMLFNGDATVSELVGAIVPTTTEPTFEHGWALPVLALAVLFMVKNGVLTLASWFRGKVVNDTEARLSTRLLATYLTNSYASLRHRDSAELIRNLLGSTVVGCATLGACVTLIANLLVAAAVLSVVMANAPGITLLAVLFLVTVSALIVALLRRHITRWGSGARELSMSLLASLRDTFGAVKDIKLLHREDYFLQRFADQRHALADIQRDHRFVSELPRAALETLFVVSALLVWTLVVAGGWSGGEGASLGLFLYAGLRLVGTFQGVVSQLVDIRYGLTQVAAVIPELSAGADCTTRIGAPAPIFQWTRAITVDAVSFTYPGASSPAVREASLEIEKGECFGIVGATGAGKSTLVDLLLGLLVPSGGEIHVDGARLSTIEEGWQRGIGFVAPAAYLINDTLRRNVAFGVRDDAVDEQRLADAIEIAQLTELVSQADRGTDTNVGERGARLSGGERQRIGLARALYQRPHTLVMDEALAAVDLDTEGRILNAIRDKLGACTLIIVTHRPFSLQFCDHVAMIEAGRVTASGDYDALSRSEEAFMRLMQSPLVQTPETFGLRYSVRG